MKRVTIVFIVVAAVSGFLLGRASVTDSPADVSVYSDATSPFASVPRNVGTTYIESAPGGNPVSDNDTVATMSAEGTVSYSAESDLVDEDTDADTYSNKAVADKLQYEHMRKIALDNYPAAQQELEKWAASHKAELKTRMNKQLGQSSGFMFEQLMRDNPLLNQPLAQQPLEADIAWRKQISSNLSDYIIMNNTDPALSVFDIACTQKKCEVTLTGKAHQAMQVLYLKMLRAQPFGLTGAPASGPVSLMNADGTFWMYLLLYF